MKALSADETKNSNVDHGSIHVWKTHVSTKCCWHGNTKCMHTNKNIALHNMEAANAGKRHETTIFFPTLFKLKDAEVAKRLLSMLVWNQLSGATGPHCWCN